MTTSHSDLLQLKNLGVASVNILRAIGIHSCDDLKQVGPVQAYIRIKLRGIHVSKVMLYALQGALQDVHWNDLDPEQKQQLVAQAEQALTTPSPGSDSRPAQRH
ncbi:TfoX/Sxy family protein [Pseudomaricurvus sp. HS19]|uniref:TfoX/Sxy family protein n=1 Tax=Pseudomaricurvus sp. HS19 TaxID=2692626 RepID=UPI00136A6364|nr:TfoX/Sxy family protein [Pseudomaricurvus sp. HS19]MYM64329.1 competence protein TfoX [Pseudomaricurvus sp. HS19]